MVTASPFGVKDLRRGRWLLFCVTLNAKQAKQPISAVPGGYA